MIRAHAVCILLAFTCGILRAEDAVVPKKLDNGLVHLSYQLPSGESCDLWLNPNNIVTVSFVENGETKDATLAVDLMTTSEPMTFKGKVAPRQLVNQIKQVCKPQLTSLAYLDPVGSAGEQHEYFFNARFLISMDYSDRTQKLRINFMESKVFEFKGPSALAIVAQLKKNGAPSEKPAEKTATADNKVGALEKKPQPGEKTTASAAK